MTNISNKIKNELDSYIEFDSSELFFDRTVRVFGGAIRDIIAEMTIHDIDIICASKSAIILDSILKEHGYHYVEGLNPKDLSNIYTDIKVITEPKTYIKGIKIIQIIKPSGAQSNVYHYIKSIERLISGVDISSCGVSYDGVHLIENVKDSILHCRNKVYQVNYGAQMSNPRRLDHRRAKLDSRGWDIIENGLVGNRDLKIDEIFKTDSSEDGYYDHVIGYEK